MKSYRGGRRGRNERFVERDKPDARRLDQMSSYASQAQASVMQSILPTSFRSNIVSIYCHMVSGQIHDWYCDARDRSARPVANQPNATH